jgi:hypothetical protein
MCQGFAMFGVSNEMVLTRWFNTKTIERFAILSDTPTELTGTVDGRSGTFTATKLDWSPALGSIPTLK